VEKYSEQWGKNYSTPNLIKKFSPFVPISLDSCSPVGPLRASIMMGWEQAVSDMEERENWKESEASVW